MGREKDKGTTEGYKEDLGKLEWTQVPFEALEGMVRVLMFGAKKYTKYNWRKGMTWSRPFEALLRHLFKWWAGEIIDEETGCSPLDHALCELLFLKYYEMHEQYKEHDDRYTTNG